MSERIRELLRRVGSEHETTSQAERELRARLPASGRGLGSVEREIASEIASSLGRAGSKLEAARELARATLAALGASPAGSAERRALLQRYADERAHAERRLRDLLIQREAIGLRSHADVQRRYPALPPPPPE